MAGRTPSVPPTLPLTRDLNDALATWSTSQRTVIGLAADFADSGEWMACGSVSAAHWIAGVADIEVCTAREWIRVGARRRRHRQRPRRRADRGGAFPWDSACSPEVSARQPLLSDNPYRYPRPPRPVGNHPKRSRRKR